MRRPIRRRSVRRKSVGYSMAQDRTGLASRLIREESLAGLAAEIACVAQLLQQRARAILRVLETGVERRRRLPGHVGTQVGLPRRARPLPFYSAHYGVIVVIVESSRKRIGNSKTSRGCRSREK